MQHDCLHTHAAQADKLAEDEVKMETGEVRYKGPGGRLETLEERQARLAHNTYMRFSRSLKSALVANIFFKGTDFLHVVDV